MPAPTDTHQHSARQLRDHGIHVLWGHLPLQTLQQGGRHGHSGGVLGQAQAEHIHPAVRVELGAGEAGQGAADATEMRACTLRDLKL